MNCELELLAPAKNLECGKAAILHGADAVYIGAKRFGARAAAGNSVEDIAELCRYAHQYDAKVYVTVNTIIYDEELEETQTLIGRLQEAGVDALLVQDMGLLEIAAGMPLHASTQTDNRTAGHVAWLRQLGFRRVVLARELSAEEVAAIHAAIPDVELEVFVHGALCVSYSGVCYASEYCFGRSANRGACAQFCRLKFDLIDADGRMVERGRYLLSLKDLCQIDRLESLVEAGACSFKIEGRLKDADYVKNVVTAYSQRLDEIVRRQPGRWRRASRGRCTYSFVPNLQKTFNRGFTHYFLDGRQPDIASPDTPKAVGEQVGTVKEIRGRSLTVAGTATFANGDGLCFINRNHELEGFRVNKVEGNRLTLLKMPSSLYRGAVLYRNNDVSFERMLSGRTADRRIPLQLTFSETASGFVLTAAVIDDGVSACPDPKVGDVSVYLLAEKVLAEHPQHEQIVRQLSRLGNTPYECGQMEISPEAERYFIAASQLSDLRRQLVDRLNTAREEARKKLAERSRSPFSVGEAPFPSTYRYYPYLYNVANKSARTFYDTQGISPVGDAFELTKKTVGRSALLMQCRHCIRYSLGYCVKRGGRRPRWREPLFLALPDGRHFRLEFDCKNCQMNVYNI